MNLGILRKKWNIRKAASTANILGSDKPDKPEPLKERHAPVTKYGQQKEIVVDGKALKEIEVTGEKQQETFPEARRNRRISRSRRKAEFEGDELKVQCRDLAPADYEGWLFKKSGGATLSPVAWKQCWVVLKNGILYLYKTSFDIAAQHAYSVRNFSVAPVEEKRKFTFKLVPKNVPPEALQDAKGVVFSCESDADVEKWCDVLNKAALGFIIQPSPQPEKVEPIRRRCQSSAVRKDKHKLTNGVSNHTGHRIRSSTFTGETTGLPATFNKTGAGTRVRKTSQSGSSSVLAVGNMFLAIDESSTRTTKGSSSDLTSIVYKEQLISNNNAKNTAEQSQAVAGPGEDEVRMEVKKEIERINKHSTKQPKPAEGEGPTGACTERADIIRQEIQDLKEESQRLNEKGSESEAGDGNEANQEVNEAEKESETENEKQALDGEVNSLGEDIDQADVKVDERDVTNETVNHDVKTKDEMPVNDKQPEVDAQELDRGLEVEEEPAEGDSGIAIEEYLNLIDSSEAETGIEEYIARMSETTDKTIEEYLASLESTAEIDEGRVGITDQAVAEEPKDLFNREESGATKGPPVAAKPSRDVEENHVGITNETTAEEPRNPTVKEETGATKGPSVAAKPSREVEENHVGITNETTAEEARNPTVKEETGATKGPPVAAKPSREMEENRVGITDETTAEEPQDPIKEESGAIKAPPVAADPSREMEESFVRISDEAIAEEPQDPITKETNGVANGPPVAAKPSRESSKEIKNNEGDKHFEGGEETPSTPSGMIPTKHQRMLIDTVLSLDYPSDSESETEDAEEICHYAQIERPSTPDGMLDEDSKQQELEDQDEVDEEFDIIICAPLEFCDKDSKHQSLMRIRDDAVLYGATEEDRSVVHHTFIKSHESDKEAGVDEDDGICEQDEGTALEGEDPSQSKAATENGVESIREKEGPEVETSRDSESDSGTDEEVDSNLHIEETRDDVPQVELVADPAEHGTTESTKELQLETNNDSTSTNLSTKLDSNDADQNINSQTTERSLEDISSEKSTEIVNVISSIQDAGVCDDDSLDKGADLLETDADLLEKNSDSVEKDADSVEKNADSVEKDAVSVEKYADAVEKDSASHSYENETDPPETNIKFLPKDDETKNNAEAMTAVSGFKDLDSGRTDVDNVRIANEYHEAGESRIEEGKGEEETTSEEQKSQENESETSTGKAVSTEDETRSIEDTRREEVSRNEVDPNNNSNNKADDEELRARPISPTAATTTIKIVNIKVNVRRPSEDFEDSDEHAEQSYPLESSV